MVKLFRIKSFAYTPFTNPTDLNYLADNGIIITNKISEADILLSQNFKHLKKYFLRYHKTKNYLVWTLEPRFDISFSLVRKIFFGFHKCHFMNIYTQDVFTSINTFHGKVIKEEIELLNHDFKLRNKKIVALMSFYQGPNAPVIIRNGENIDLIALRSKIALEGHKRGVLYIYGKGWPQNISLENSRYEDWVTRKEEVLKNYNFNLCFENTIAPNYVTEKIWDSIGNYCLPIYYGKGTNIYNIFPEKSFIDFSDFDTPQQLFNYIGKMKNTEFVGRLNKCIEVYMTIKNQNPTYAWEKRKEALDKIIERCYSIAEK